MFENVFIYYFQKPEMLKLGKECNTYFLDEYKLINFSDTF